MKPWKINIMVIGGTLLVIFLTSAVAPTKVQTVVSIIVLVTAIWVYFDARKLQIQKYKPTLFGRGPISYAWITGILWIVLFPAYISFRQKIKDGKVPLRDGSFPTNTQNL